LVALLQGQRKRCCSSQHCNWTSKNAALARTPLAVGNVHGFADENKGANAKRQSYCDRRPDPNGNAAGYKQHKRKKGVSDPEVAKAVVPEHAISI